MRTKPRSQNQRSADVAELTKAQAKAEHKRLALEIAAHDKRYYQDDAPSVSDAEYDALRQRYNAIEARFPELRHARTACRSKVGAAPSRGFAKVRHAVPMLSLDNAFSRGGRDRFRRPHPPLPQARRTTSRSPSPPSRRSTGCRCRCATRTASWSPPRPAATAPRARTSPPTSARSKDIPHKLKGQQRARRSARCAARST